jgi:sugar phosphate isomerase/epimerase
MRLGCAAYSFRDPIQAGRLTLEQFVDLCAEMGMDGVELTSYYFSSTDRSTLNELKRYCFKRGMHILGTAVGSNFTQADEGKRRDHVQMTRSWIDHSVILGAPCVRVFAGPVPQGVSEDQAFGWALDCIRECVEYGAGQGVAVALENHGGVTGTARGVQRFLDAIDSPWFGLNLDFGNFQESPYEEFEQLAPRTITTHVKVTSRFGETTAELDYARIRRIMEAAGYRGYFSIEYEEPGDPMEGVRAFAQQLKAALSG